MIGSQGSESMWWRYRRQLVDLLLPTAEDRPLEFLQTVSNWAKVNGVFYSLSGWNMEVTYPSLLLLLSDRAGEFVIEDPKLAINESKRVLQQAYEGAPSSVHHVYSVVDLASEVDWIVAQFAIVTADEACPRCKQSGLEYWVDSVMNTIMFSCSECGGEFTIDRRAIVNTHPVRPALRQDLQKESLSLRGDRGKKSWWAKTLWQ